MRSSRFVIPFLAAVSLYGLAPARAQSPLTFEERLKAQEAIERVYDRHRVWPKDNATPRPPFEKLVPPSVVEKKVEGYLKQSAVLREYWQRPLTVEQIQAEMDRMAKHTKDPQTLKGLFAALHNDPRLIAECLARPALASRLSRSWYAYDERFHGDVKARARYAEEHLTEANFASWPEGEYSAVHLRADLGEESLRPQFGPQGRRDRVLDPKEFTEAASHFPAKGQAAMEETDEAFILRLTTDRTSDELRGAVRVFRKRPYDQWLAGVSVSPMAEDAGPCAYHTPELMATGLYTPDSWAKEAFSPVARVRHTAIWTGEEMIIWGGNYADDNGTLLNSGARYNPALDSWTGTSTGANCPTPREDHTAVWTGQEMIVWGGNCSGNLDTKTGGRYNPALDTWTATSTGAGCPDPKVRHTAVWTGTCMVVWGGSVDNPPPPTGTGGRYNPTTDTWTPTSTGTNCPANVWGHTAVWTGIEMIVWGCALGGTPVGARYDPFADTWIPVPPASAPAGVQLRGHSAVWTGREMIIWGGGLMRGGYGGYPGVNTGGRYNPSTDTWEVTSTTGAPEGRGLHTAVWTGSEMIVWGGAKLGTAGGLESLDSGGRYNPTTNSWTATPTGTGCPVSRFDHTAVWTGQEMIVWGGEFHGSYYSNVLRTGARYNPSSAVSPWVAVDTGPDLTFYANAGVWTGSAVVQWGGVDLGNTPYNTGTCYYPALDFWEPTSTLGAPEGRGGSSAVWTGRHMIVWGGYSSSGSLYTVLNTGGRYEPSSDTWSAATSLPGAPSGRYGQEAFWTGSRMLVWGGYESVSQDQVWVNTGALYAFDPANASDPGSWTATSTTGAPDMQNRRSFSAVWTGKYVIVWGGVDSSFTFFNTGSMYYAQGDSWTATSTAAGCPTGRAGPSVVWTGSHMIVWGGWTCADSNCYTTVFHNDGARFDPESGIWQATSTGSNCPSERYGSSVVWTGREMIVWGNIGLTGSPATNTGARYTFDPTNPSDPGSWTPTSLVDAPEPKDYLALPPFWTGTGMLFADGSAIYFTDTSPTSAPVIQNAGDTVTLGDGLPLRLGHDLPAAWWDDCEGTPQWTGAGDWHHVYGERCTSGWDYYSPAGAWRFGSSGTCAYTGSEGTYALTSIGSFDVSPDAILTFRSYLDTEASADSAQAQLCRCTSSTDCSNCVSDSSWVDVAVDQTHWAVQSPQPLPMKDRFPQWRPVQVKVADYLFPGEPSPPSCTAMVRFLFHRDASPKTHVGWIVDDVGVGEPAGDGSNPCLTPPDSQGSDPQGGMPYHDAWDKATFEWDLTGNGLGSALNPDRSTPVWSLSEDDLITIYGRENVLGDHEIYLRVKDTYNDPASNHLTLHVRDGQSPTATLLVPNGGESWDYSEPGNPKSHWIVWNASDNFGITSEKLSYTTKQNPTEGDWTCIAASGALGDAWEFDSGGDLEGWNNPHNVTAAVAGGTLNLAITGPDPYIYSTILNVDASRYRYVKVRMSHTTTGTLGGIYWMTQSDMTWNPDKFMSFPVTSQGAAEYVIDMSSHPKWAGTIVQLRLDPLEDASAGTASVDYVRISSQATRDLYPDSTSFLWDMPTQDGAAATGQTFPSASAKVRVEAWDASDNRAQVVSAATFYVVQPTTTAVKTLILTDTDRIDLYPLAPGLGGAVYSKLLELAGHGKVNGVVRDLKNVAGLPALYQAWDADRMNVDKANAVAGAISEYVKALVDTYPNVQYLVLAGADQVIPSHRVPDSTEASPEHQYWTQMDCSWPTGAAIMYNNYLTDARFGDLSEEVTGVGAHFLALPDLATGRLVDSPQEIIDTVDHFISQDGQVSLGKVYVSGYDFLEDSATAIRDEYQSAGKTVDSRLGAGWTADDLKADLFTSPVHALHNLNGHSDHWELGAPSGGNLTTAAMDACAGRPLEGSLFYNVGCHSGLSVYDGSNGGKHPLDLPQLMLRKGVAAYVGSTGYGWGLRYGVGYGERLMELITERILTQQSAALGAVLGEAKRDYFLENHRYDVFDEKTLMESTLYGLPMYQVVVSQPSKSQGRELAAEGPDDQEADGITLHKTTRLPGTSKDLPDGLGEVKMQFLYAQSAYQKVTTPSGTSYYTLNGLCNGEIGDSLQPLFNFDSRLSNTVNRGVLFTGGRFSTVTPFIPTLGVPMSSEVVYGAGPLPPGMKGTIGTVTRTTLPPGGSSRAEGSSLDLTRLTVYTGVYDSEGGGKESLFDRLDFAMYYSNSADHADPVITDPGPDPDDDLHELSGLTANFSVQAGDASGVYRVVIAYTDRAGETAGEWQSFDLAYNTSSGRWEGSLELRRGITYLAQAVDKAGNVGLLKLTGNDVVLDGGGHPVNTGSTYVSARTFTIELLDSDGDGMPDAWEIPHGLNPNVNDAALDPDSDGLTNGNEFNANTDPQNPDTDGDGDNDGSEVHHNRNPLDPSDGKRLSIRLAKSGGSVVLNWPTGTGDNGVIDGPYWVYRSSDPLFSSTEVLAGMPLATGTQAFTDTGATGGSKFFYFVTNTPVTEAPAVLALVPDNGPAAGGTEISVFGNNFVSGAGVKIGGANALNVVWRSVNLITCTTPAGTTGPRDVTVTNPDGKSGTKVGGWTYE